MYLTKSDCVLLNWRRDLYDIAKPSVDETQKNTLDSDGNNTHKH